MAEVIDTNLGGGEDARDVMRLLLVASLANVPGAIQGLAVPEIVANLCAPGRDVSRLQNEAIARLVTAAWYLHSTSDGRLHVRRVQNLVARVTSTAGAYLRDQATGELRSRLEEIFKPVNGWCYQRLAPLPAVDEIDPSPDKVILVVSEPHPSGLHPDLVRLYEQLTYRNRVCFLTGQRAFDSLLDRAREIKAVNQIITELQQDGVRDSDPQMQQARDQLLPRFVAQFHSAVRETFTTLHYPTRDRLAKVDFLMEFKENRYDGEQQVVAALAAKQKYTEDVSGETFRKKVEARLFTQQSMLWSEVVRRAATSPAWQWHRPDALDRLKAECVHQDAWREDGSYVDKGPFPKPATSVRIQELSRDDETGLVKLRLSPVNGDCLYAEYGAPATSASMTVDRGEFETDAIHVSFLVRDSKGEHETGDPVAWSNRVTLRSREYTGGGGRRVELRAAPPAPIRYTTDGSDPRVNGGAYDGPFAVPAGARLVLAVAEKDGAVSETHRREIADEPVDRPIDRTAPAVWRPDRGFTFETTRTAYGFLNRLKKHEASAGGLRFNVTADQTWGELSLSEDVALDGMALEQAVEQLRRIVPAGEVAIEARRIHYASGQRFLDHVADIKATFKRDDVEP